MKKLLIVFIIAISVFGTTQAQRPIDTWRSYLPYVSARFVAQSDDRIYCATADAVFYIEKGDGSISTLNKAKGLSDQGVRSLGYHNGKKTLIIAYNNSNIDLLQNGTDIYNIPDIKNTVLSSSKNINDVAIIGDYAYLATDIGISVLDLDKKEIKENYIIGKTGGSVRVNSICSDGTRIYAATAEGLKSALLSTANLQNFNNWHLYTSSEGLPVGEVAMTGSIGSYVYAVVADSLFSAQNGIFSKIRNDRPYSYQTLTKSGNYLFASMNRGSTGGAKTLKIKADGTIEELYLDKSNRTEQVIDDGTHLWVADYWDGLLKYDGYTYNTNIRPNGPPNSGVFRMAAADKNLYLATGGIDDSYLYYRFDAAGPVIYEDGSWSSYPTYNNLTPSIEGCYDLVDVAVDVAHQKAYYASIQGGLIEMDLTTKAFTKYDASNSPLTTFFGLTKISALCLDRSGNLWMSNNGTPQTLTLKTYDGNWKKFTVQDDITTVRQMMVDANGYIWMTGRNDPNAGNAHLVVYDPGQDILDPSDDKYRSIGAGTGNGALPNTNVWCAVADKNGDVWVGTDEGIGTFYCSGSIFSNYGCDADRIKVSVDGFIGYLFSTEIVKAIAVDGANRKWVGTTKGIWLISDDGKTQLKKFTTDNSPLPSNTITHIAIDQHTGEVFIGTEQGLVSYQGDAILGGESKGTALVYPNPVRPNYTGPIAIKGLVDNAYVKITDAGGILVYQGRANGGQMIWDGKGYNGVRVNTGIYIVYAATDAGKEHNVGKIIFIN